MTPSSLAMSFVAGEDTPPQSDQVPREGESEASDPAVPEPRDGQVSPVPDHGPVPPDTAKEVQQLPTALDRWSVRRERARRSRQSVVRGHEQHDE